MITYLLRRLLWLLPVLWAAATLVWILMFLIPGDPARALSGQSVDPDVLAGVRAEWGLDQPAPVRYGRFVGKLARLDLGTSYVQRRPVSEIVAEGFMRTLFLAVAASALAALIGLGLAMASAALKGGILDGAALLFSAAGMSVPTFWLGLMLMLVFSSSLGWFPVSGYGDGGSILGVRLPGFRHIVLPSLTLAISSSALLSRVARASLLEESSRDYARAARARGASSGATLMSHVLFNSLLPIITILGLNFGYLLGGAIVTETVFNWPGLGRMMWSAIGSRDLPLIEGGVLLMTAAFLLVNLATDVLYWLLDPRTRD
jgi:ABC-type dipeptide/oligopeptide/nickel transport system permease component